MTLPTALREKVKGAIIEAYSHNETDEQIADAAIRAVLTHYAENGGTISMCQAALEDSRAQPERYLPTGKEPWAAERTMQAMMRAAMAEREN